MADSNDLLALLDKKDAQLAALARFALNGDRIKTWDYVVELAHYYNDTALGFFLSTLADVKDERAVRP